MKTIFELCEPRDDGPRSGIKESDFAADLAQVLRGKAPAKHADPAHPTAGLPKLLANVFRRLSRPELVEPGRLPRVAPFDGENADPINGRPMGEGTIPELWTERNP